SRIEQIRNAILEQSVVGDSDQCKVPERLGINHNIGRISGNRQLHTSNGTATDGRFTGSTSLGGNDDDTISTPNAIDGCCSRVLQYLDRLNIIYINIVQIGLYAINQHQWRCVSKG